MSPLTALSTSVEALSPFVAMHFIPVLSRKWLHHRTLTVISNLPFKIFSPFGTAVFDLPEMRAVSLLTGSAYFYFSRNQDSKKTSIITKSLHVSFNGSRSHEMLFTIWSVVLIFFFLHLTKFKFKFLDQVSY